MKYVTHTIRLKSDKHFGRRVPPWEFGRILSAIPVAVDRSIRMAFEKRSIGKGPRPTWLDSSADIRFVGHEGDDETLLYFEAPQFGEAAVELYQQKEIWPSRPDPNDTGFDLLGDVIMDVSRGNADSDLFDVPLLKRIVNFKTGLNGSFQEMQIAGHRYTDDNPAIINLNVVHRAGDLCSTTPSVQRARLVGVLDMLRGSTRTFALKLMDGQEVRGVLVEGDIGRLTEHFREEVLVLGRSVFRPSGKLLRIDADQVERADNESPIWSRLPQPSGARLDVSTLRKPQGPRSGLAAIIGKWPGEESDEEILQELKALS